MIVLYGGSFSPATKAHLQIVKELNDKFIIDKIIIMPSCEAPEKELMAFKDRFWILNKMFKKFKNVIVSDYEKKHPFKGSYYQLLDIEKKYKEKPYLVMGADNFRDIDKWVNSEKLIKEFPIILFNRNHLYTWNKISKFNVDNNSQIHFLDFKMDISSTMVRNDYINNKDLLTPETYKYLKSKKYFVEPKKKK